MSDKLTLLAGGNTVYVYPDVTEPGVADRVATQRMMLDVVYPGDDTDVCRIAADRWTEDLRSKLLAEGLEIVDTRGEG